MTSRRRFHDVLRSGGFPIAAALLALVLVGTLGAPDLLAAQSQEARQMRHFWHVFIAYAIAWILLFGWLVSILKRIRRVEERLGAQD